MLVVALTLVSPAPIWRSYEEVFDLAVKDGRLIAATNGGLVREPSPTGGEGRARAGAKLRPSGMGDGEFRYLEWTRTESPTAIREIILLNPLVFRLADGNLAPPTHIPAKRKRTLEEGLLLNPGDPWPLKGVSPPPAYPYAVLKRGETLFSGTSDGLYRASGGKWTREKLPSALPVSRPNGIAQIGDTYVVGGIGGLFIGRPGGWKEVATDAIRQIHTVGKEVWAIHGSGAVSKLEPETDRLYTDVLHGAAKRPWTASFGRAGNLLLFGGHGGWSERGKTLTERYPAELKGDVVTALTGSGAKRWIGTQKSGLFRFEGAKVRRWNPGNGLADTWITALLPTKDGLIVGTSGKGLYRLVGDQISPLESPTRRVTSLAQSGPRLVVGGMDGAWSREGKSWKSLETSAEETTSLTITNRQLTVTTAAGIHFR